MLKLRKVAVTGGLSCGKSSVCLILKELGAYVVSADKIVHQLLSSDAKLIQKVVHLLGPEILVNGAIDRTRIANIVFHNLELLIALEELVHPAVYKEIDRIYQMQQNLPKPPPLFVVENPMLFESKENGDFDRTIAVVADLENCCKRFMEKTGYDQTEFNHRMARQLPNNEKASRADYVIYNNGSLADLQQTTKDLYQELIK